MLNYIYNSDHLSCSKDNSLGEMEAGPVSRSSAPCSGEFLCFRYPAGTKHPRNSMIQLFQDPNIFRFSSVCSQVDKRQPTYGHGAVNPSEVRGNRRTWIPSTRVSALPRGRQETVRLFIQQYTLVGSAGKPACHLKRHSHSLWSYCLTFSSPILLDGKQHHGRGWERNLAKET